MIFRNINISKYQYLHYGQKIKNHFRNVKQQKKKNN
jgi:hypothetical protein